jgi:hypothetical protein
MSRWLKSIAIGLAAVVFLISSYVAFVWFFGSDVQRYWLALSYVAVTANHSPPPIAANGVLSNDTNWMMTEPASAKFTAILRKRFPRGSSEEAMRVALTAQGFKDDTSANTLTYEWGGVPCKNTLRVLWVGDKADHLSEISGHYYAACL